MLNFHHLLLVFAAGGRLDGERPRGEQFRPISFRRQTFFFFLLLGGFYEFFICIFALLLYLIIGKCYREEEAGKLVDAVAAAGQCLSKRVYVHWQLLVVMPSGC